MKDNSENNVVLVIDSMPLRREQLVRFLGLWIRENNLTIIASDLGDVFELKQAQNCRLIIFSVGSGRISETKPSAAVRVLAVLYPQAPLVVMAEANDLGNADSARSMGAAAYLPASLEADVALAALSFVLAGGTYFPPELMNGLKASPPTIPPQERQARLSPPRKTDLGSESSKPGDGDKSGNTNGTKVNLDRLLAGAGSDQGNESDLTLRQMEVLSYLKVGLSNKHIARELHMSEATVKVHVRQVMRKLGVCNRTQVAIMAMNHPKDEPREIRPPAEILTLLRSESARAAGR